MQATRCKTQQEPRVCPGLELAVRFVRSIIVESKDKGELVARIGKYCPCSALQQLIPEVAYALKPFH